MILTIISCAMVIGGTLFLGALTIKAGVVRYEATALLIEISYGNYDREAIRRAAWRYIHKEWDEPFILKYLWRPYSRLRSAKEIRDDYFGAAK